MNRYDIMIAQRVNSFNLTNILSDDKNNLYKGINKDYFEFYQKNTQTPDLMLGPFIWSIDSMTINQMKLSTNLGANCVVRDLATGERYQVTRCAIKITLHLDELLNRPETNDTWIDFSANIEVEENLSLLTVHSMKTKMEAFLKGRKTAIRELFFKKEVCSKFKLHDNVTASTIFIHQADQGMNGAYFCLGQMLDSRTLPDKPNFPDDIAKASPPFIFHLSPYAYFCIGLKPNLQKQYPDNILSFDEEHSKLTLYNFPIDKESIAKTLKIEKGQVTEASIRELSFCLSNAYFSYQYEMHLHIKETKWIFIPDPYRIEAKAKQFFHMYLESNQIDVQELPNMNEFKAVKSADHPMIDSVIEEIEKDMLLVADLLIRIAIPLAIDIGCGLNPVAGCALFSLFNTFADFMEDAYKERKENESIEEARQLNALQMSFKKFMPFSIDDVQIKKFEIRDGVIISGNVGSIQPRPFLLKGECLVPQQRLKLAYEGGKLYTMLYFWERGNLVLHETIYDPPLAFDKDVFWSSSWKHDTRDSDSVVFGEDGSLIMSQGKKVTWQFKTGNPNVNIFFLIHPQENSLAFGLAHISDADMDRILKNDINYYHNNIMEILARSKTYYVRD